MAIVPARPLLSTIPADHTILHTLLLPEQLVTNIGLCLLEDEVDACVERVAAHDTAV